MCVCVSRKPPMASPPRAEPGQGPKGGCAHWAVGAWVDAGPPKGAGSVGAVGGGAVGRQGVDAGVLGGCVDRCRVGLPPRVARLLDHPPMHGAQPGRAMGGAGHSLKPQRTSQWATRRSDPAMPPKRGGTVHQSRPSPWGGNDSALDRHAHPSPAIRSDWPPRHQRMLPVDQTLPGLGATKSGSCLAAHPFCDWCTDPPHPGDRPTHTHRSVPTGGRAGIQ